MDGSFFQYAKKIHRSVPIDILSPVEALTAPFTQLNISPLTLMLVKHSTLHTLHMLHILHIFQHVLALHTFQT